MTDNYNAATVPADQLKALQARLIASQLREKALREAVSEMVYEFKETHTWNVPPMALIRATALARLPTDTAEADALLEKLRELEKKVDLK